jgi:hypothetical protein
MRKFISLFVALLFSACTPLAPKPDEIRSADYGQMPPQEAVTPLVQTYMSQLLFDPYSAVYACGAPLKAWVNWYSSLYYGYVVWCNINAKNRFGGYVGAQRQGFLIKDHSVLLHGDFAYIGYVP